MVLKKATRTLDSEHCVPVQGPVPEYGLRAAGSAALASTKSRHGYNDSENQPVTRLVVMLGLIAGGANGTERPETFSQYCYVCHSDAIANAGINLERLTRESFVADNFKEWQWVAAALEQHSMPPPGAPTPAERECREAARWIRESLADCVGKHGPVTVRRLTSAEYAYTIRDLRGGPGILDHLCGRLYAARTGALRVSVCQPNDGTDGCRDGPLPFDQTLRLVDERASERANIGGRTTEREAGRHRESGMDDGEYFELARLIQGHILELGLDHIADFNNYANDEGEDSPPPDGKTLIRLMLAAFDRYLAANAAETVAESLQTIALNIDDGESPTRALVHPTDDRLAYIEGLDEPVEVVGLQNIVEIRTALKRLEQRLLEEAEPILPDGGMA